MTRQVRIVALDPTTLASLAAGDLDSANLTSPVELTAYLVGDESRSTWTRRARQVVESPVDAPWVTGVVWDEQRGCAVGRAGFHEAPHADGLVEVGYAIDPGYRRCGYARAALAELVDRARRDPQVRRVRASVSPHNAASLGLIAQFGFVQVGEQWDDEDGLELLFEIAVS